MNQLDNSIQQLHNLKAVTELMSDLLILVIEWSARAHDAIPDEYRDRELEDKYLRLDNEASGLYSCSTELMDVLKKYENILKE